MLNSSENTEKDAGRIEDFIFHIKRRARKVIVEEGIKDYRNDRVTRIRKNDIWFAVVHDDEDSYEVTIDLRRYHYSCLCSQQAPCKHVFAFSAALKDMLVSDLFASISNEQKNLETNVHKENNTEIRNNYDKEQQIRKSEIPMPAQPKLPRPVMALYPLEDLMACVFYNEENEVVEYKDFKEFCKWIEPYDDDLYHLFGHKRFISLEFFNVLDFFPQLISSIYIDKERVEFDEPVQELDISLQKVNRLDEIDIEKIRNELIETYNVSGDILEKLLQMVIEKKLGGKSSEGFLIDGKIFLEPSWEQQGWQRFGKFLLINREVHPPKIRVINISLPFRLFKRFSSKHTVDVLEVFELIDILKKYKAKNLELLPPYYSYGPTPILHVSTRIKKESPDVLAGLDIQINFAYTQKRLSKKNRQELLDDAPFFPPPYLVETVRQKKLLTVNEQNQVILRKPKNEYKIFNKLQSYTKFKRNGSKRITRNQLENFFVEDLPYLHSMGVEVKLPEELALLKIKPKPSMLDIHSSGINWFSADIQVEGMDDASLQEVIKAAKENKSHLRLNDGRWINVRDLQLEKIFSLLESLGIRHNKKGKIEKISKGQATALLLEANIRTEKLTEKTQKQLRLWLGQDETKEPVQVLLPNDFSAMLRPYQKTGVDFLFERHNANIGGILADDMGLGKTVQGLTFLYALYHKKQSRFLIIAPPAALAVWKQELLRFCPSLPWQLWHGVARHNQSLIEAGVVITSYGTLQKDMEFFSQQKAFETILIDEAQYLKNHRSISAQAVRTVQTRTIFCLTGTPLENHPIEIWSLMDLILPGLLGTIKSFKNTFDRDITDIQVEQLRRRISPFILRRTRDEVLKDLPERTVQDIIVPMTKEQTLAYEVCRQEAVAILNDAGENYLMKMLPYLMKLRRISCHPSLADKQSDPLGSGKLIRLAEMADVLEETAHGILVFSQFTDMLDTMERFLKQRQQKFLRIDGSTTAKQREQRVKTFQEQKDILYFLISLRAGGNAITLHRADTVLHLDPWWNPAVEEQATARAHRMGQKNSVFVYRFFSEQSVEEKVLTLQQKKRKLFDDLFGGKSQKSIGSFDRNELLELLRKPNS